MSFLFFKRNGGIEMKEKDSSKRNLNLIMIETILTSIGAGFSVPIISIFWNSIGMNQTDIGFVQMMFTIVIVLLDIPMGYLADRFNRKVLNIVGDIGVALTFIYYAFSKNMYMAILSECLLGVCMSMTNGVDQAFIKNNADKIDKTGKLFKKLNSQIYTYRYSAMFIVMLIGGIISKYSLRLAVGISFLPYFIGGIVAFFIKDDSKKIESNHKNMLKDMCFNVKEILKDKKVRNYLLAYVIGSEITHPQIWVFTPLMIMVGVPIEIVSLGWILTQIFQILGAKLAEKLVEIKTSVKFIAMIAISILWMGVLVINTNIFTIWVFVLNGLIRGLFSGSIVTPLQENTKEEHQTSVISIASTGAKILYIPLVYIINYLGNIKLQLALLGMIVIFTPISLYVYNKLRKSENINKT